MKAGVTPQLSSKWWKENRPITLKTVGMTPALKNYERVLSRFLQDSAKSVPYPDIEGGYHEVVEVLDGEVTSAIDKGIQAAGFFNKDTKAALTKYKTQVIPQTHAQLLAKLKDAGKEYAVLTLEMDKKFKAIAVELRSAMNLVNRSNDVLTGYETTLTDFLDDNSDLKPHDADQEAMKASKYANEVHHTLSKAVEEVLHDARLALDTYQENMFLTDAQKALRKHAEYTNDAGNQLSQVWKLAEKRCAYIGDLFKAVLKRTSGMEKVENQYYTSMDNQLHKVQAPCQQLSELTTEVDKRENQGLKNEIELAKIVKQETKIPKQLKKLEEGGLTGELLKKAQNQLLNMKEGILQEKRQVATNIYKFYQETTRKAVQGKELAAEITLVLDNLPEPPEEVDIKSKRFQKRQLLLSHFRGIVRKAGPVMEKGKEKAEDRIRYYDENVFNRKN